MDLIVAVDQNWAIGYQDSLLVRIPADQKFFRETTMGHTIILGRKALAGFPNGLPLAGRTNIILSHNPDFKVKNGIVVHDIHEMAQAIKRQGDDTVFVCGGQQVYELLLPYCRYAHVTKIDYAYQADSYFPNLDKLENWKLIGDSEEQTYFDLEYGFYLYENQNPLPLA